MNNFVCHICNKSFKTLKLYTNHYLIHTNISNVLFPCPIPNCNLKFKKYAGLNTHFRRYHPNSNLTNSSHISSKFKNMHCSACRRQFSSGKVLIAHMKSHLRSSQSIDCPYDSCDKVFHKVQSFSGHVSRYHKYTRQDITFLNNEDQPLFSTFLNNEDQDLNCSTSHQNLTSTSYQNLEQFSSNTDNLSTDSKSLFLNNLSLFYMKLQTQHNVPASVVQLIFDELNKFCLLNLEAILSFLTSKLVDLGLTVTQIESLKSETIKKNEFIEVQSQLQSDYLRKSYFKTKFGFIEPVCIRLGYNIDNKLSFFHYVPILYSLEAFLKNNSVQEQLNHNMNFNEGFLTDYKDGSCFKNHSFWKTKSRALQILLYQDSFEVVNPLGSAKNKHKILAMYYTLGNLPFYSRSKINAMQLVLLCKEKDYKQFKFDVFKPLVRDLKILEESGINVPDIGILKGSVMFIIGDNLGSHGVGGFTESFSSASNICRFCSITGKKFQKKPHSLTATERTINSYNHAVDILKNGTVEIYDGIKFNSVFNDLLHFHVCQPGMPPCIGHDLFEGIVAYDLPLIMKYFVKTKKFLTYKSLNNMIKRFPYKNDDAADKPGIILDNKDKVLGHAAQNWCLIRFITLIISDTIIDKEDKVWKCLCLLQEIVSLVCAKVINEGQVAYLKILIEEYLFDRKVLFPEKSLRPKHHYLLHYPSLILKYGPLIWLWTMRFESKHSFFKKAVRQSNNFINVTLTMSEKHQLHQAYLQTGDYFSAPVLMKDGKRFIHSQCSKNILAAIDNCPLSHFNNELLVGNSVSIFSTQFRVDDAILLKNDFREVKFGIIKLILLNSSIVHFVVEPVVGEKLLYQYIYEIAESFSTLLCVKHELFIPPPMYVYKINDKRYLVPRYAFIM